MEKEHEESQEPEPIKFKPGWSLTRIGYEYHPAKSGEPVRATLKEMQEILGKLGAPFAFYAADPGHKIVVPHKVWLDKELAENFELTA